VRKTRLYLAAAFSYRIVLQPTTNDYKGFVRV